MKTQNIFKIIITIILLWLFVILLRIVIRYWMDVPEELFIDTVLWGSLNTLFIIPLYFFLKYINKTIKK